MQLLQSWKESLLIFKPSNFKLFLTVTLKSILETYKSLFYYFWWLIGILIFLSLNKVSLGLEMLRWLIGLVFVYITLLVVRPSVSRKDETYFAQYIFNYYMIPILLLVIVLSYFYYFIVGVIPIFIFPMKGHLFANLIIMHPVWLSPLIILFGLFYLDSDKSFPSLWFSLCKALLMFVYNYPILFILYAALISIFYPFLFFMHGEYLEMFLLLFKNFPFIFLIPMMYTIVSNMYIKQVYEHFGLYFGKRRTD